jgi:integrase
VLPFIETSLMAGFLHSYPDLEVCPFGVNQQFIRAYWGKFGVNAGVNFDTNRLRSDRDLNTPVLMMAKASANTPQIKSSNGRLQIVLNHGGKRSYLSLGVPDSNQNRAYAQTIASQIWNDILCGNFKGIQKYKRTTQIEPEQTVSVNISLVELWEKFTDYKRNQLSQTTIAKDYDRVRCNIAKLPSFELTDAVKIRDFLLRSTSPNTAKRVLSKLSAACEWGVISKLVDSNPFTGMSAGIRKPKKDDRHDIKPFTPEERDLIIQKFKSDGSHYAPLVEFLFRTGCRPSEAIALQAKHISKDYRSITFCQSITISENGLQLKQGLKTQSQRVFPCGDSLRDFLMLLVGNERDPDLFLFASPVGNFTNIDRFSNRHWRKTLKFLNIAERGIYQCRHTYITFCLDSGMDAKDVAKLVGNSPEMIYRHYAGVKKDLMAPGF